MIFGWLFRRQRRSELEGEVEEDRKTRDKALGDLGDAIDEVDRGHDRLLADYKRANGIVKKKAP